MAHLLDTPRRPRSTESRARKAAKRENAAVAFQRAGFEFALIRIIHDQPATFSLRTIQGVLRDAIRVGTYTLTNGTTLAIPTAPSLGETESLSDPLVVDRITPSHTWVASKRAIPPTTLTLNSLLHRPRSGRPPNTLPSVLRDVLLHHLLSNGAISDRMLVRYVHTAATERGIQRPSRARILRAIKEIPALTRAGARHGKRAAIADAATKSALPVERPYQMFVFDEGTLPVWVRVYDPDLHAYVAIRLPICLVIDVASQLVVGYAITNPRARGAEMHMDSLEMTAAVLSSILPALAPAECRPYVGFLPELVGCDNIAAHNSVIDALARVGIPVTQHRPYAPYSHGPRETVVGIIKTLCEPLLGFDGRWVVAETVEQDPTVKRRQLSGSTMRQSPLANVALDQLMDIATFREAFGAVIRTYNRELEHSRWREPREARFYERRRTEHLRPWTEAMGMLEPHRVSVREHLTVRGVAFATASDIGHQFAQGETVTVHVDPLLRAAFVQGETAAAWGTLLPAIEYAKHIVPGEYVRARSREAQLASDAARAERDAMQATALGGPGAAAHANAVADALLGKATKAQRSRRRAAKVATVADVLTAHVATSVSEPRITAAPPSARPTSSPRIVAPAIPPSPPAGPPSLTIVPGALTGPPRGAAAAPALRGLVRRSSSGLLLTGSAPPPSPTTPTAAGSHAPPTTVTRKA